MTSPLEQCRDALRRLTGAAFPVSTEIDSSGYAWSHAYLDSALPGALAALAAADAALAAQTGLTPINDLVRMPDGAVMHKDDAAAIALKIAPVAQPEPVAWREQMRGALQQATLALEELDGPGYLIGGVMHHRIGLLLPMLGDAINALNAAPVAAPVAQPLTDQDRRDAERYRWLLETGGPWWAWSVRKLGRPDLNAAIDAAMSAPKEPA